MSVNACNFAIVSFIKNYSASCPHADAHLDRWFARIGDLPRLVALRRRIYAGLRRHDSGHAQGIRFESARLVIVGSRIALPPRHRSGFCTRIIGSGPQGALEIRHLCEPPHT